MIEPTVSIIIPVRNVEKYIERCIKSVQAQTHKKIDIILLLNDSTDQSETICKTFASTDHRIRLICIKEAGVSKARNTGIELALGDYIVFVDADDYIHKFLVQRLYSEIIKHKTSIAVACFEKYNINALGNEYDNKSVNKKVSADSYAKNMLLGKSEYTGYIWGKMYCTEIMSDTRFDETLAFSEDTDFLLRMLRKKLQIFMSPFVGYFYSQDTSGVTKDTTGDKRFESLTLSKAFVKNAPNNKIRAAARCYYWRNAFYLLQQKSISADKQGESWNAIKKHRMAVMVNTSSPIKYRLLALLSVLHKSVFMYIILKLVNGR